jgi:putative membrane-bound dehydrogenase-like protein
MNRPQIKSLLHLLLLLISCNLILASCKNENKQRTKAEDSLAIREAFASSPVLTPEESLKKMKVEDGFTVKLVAAEPLVTAPVALVFDEKGRIWVDEMEGYMPDTSGTGEDKPVGKISILEDTDQDGVMDARKVFMDGLVLPRALCLIENGILIAEPPYLWFVEIDNDKPGKKTLVDSAYAAGGNAEHQANGLLRGLDNWIYSANSEKRYRKNGSQWLIERTHDRGQWGISQDDFGRMFYNNNSQNALGDYFAPGLGATNPNQKDVAGFDEKVVENNRVYPLRPTPGVNRGYMEGILDDSLRLVNFTAASGPVVYRGDLFAGEYHHNLFVGEPSANLVKRNILTSNGNVVEGQQAYAGKEFLSSVDERFRPVTLYNGPDGALYIVDMYRGIIQHKTYLTPYLKKEIGSRKLEQPLSCGRIYKVVPSGKKTAIVKMPNDPMELVKLLKHPNGWVRDKAQQMLVDGKYPQAIPPLSQNLQLTASPLTVIHSLWTLEGLNALQPQHLIPLLDNADQHIKVQALYALSSTLNKSNIRTYLPVIEQLSDKKASLLAPYIVFLIQNIRPLNAAAANGLTSKVLKQFPHDEYVADAVISTLKGKEAAFLKQSLAINNDTLLTINKQLKKVLDNIKNAANKAAFKDYPKGAAIFKSVCQTCHGADGNGIKSLAPPLNRSEWVNGSSDKLLSIVLYGLTGPVKVNGKVYKAPEIAGEMPGIGNNKDYKDEDIAELMNLIRKSWSNKAGKISIEDVTKMRQKYAGRQKAFTVEELNAMKSR